MFPDRHDADAYEKTLREIFPEVRHGSFTYRSDADPAIAGYGRPSTVTSGT